MRCPGLLALAGCILLGHNTAASASDSSILLTSEPPALQANPFSRPRDLTSRRGPQPADPDSSAGQGRDLRAVLAGKNRGMANLGGELVETGSLYNGYRLMRIERDTAIFMRDGAEIRLEIGEDLPDE